METDDEGEKSTHRAESSLREVYHGHQNQIPHESANENPTNLAEEILDKTYQNDRGEASVDHVKDVPEILDDMKVQLFLLRREPPAQERWASLHNIFQKNDIPLCGPD